MMLHIVGNKFQSGYTGHKTEKPNLHTPIVGSLPEVFPLEGELQFVHRPNVYFFYRMMCSFYMSFF